MKTATDDSDIRVTRNPAGEVTEVVGQLCFARLIRMERDKVMVGMADIKGRVALMVITAKHGQIEIIDDSDGKVGADVIH